MIINRNFIFIFLFFLIQFFSFTTHSVEPEEVLENEKQETRARNISKNIRCMICQNQSIDESNAAIAKDLRILIRNKIKEGSSDREIYKFLPHLRPLPTKELASNSLLIKSIKLKMIIMYFIKLV